MKVFPAPNLCYSVGAFRVRISMSSPIVPTPAPQRPLGVVFAAIVLMLMACFGLLNGGLVLFGAAFIHPPQYAQHSMTGGVEVAAGALILLISGCCVYVAVGLFRTKRWARLSILILGGLLAGYSFIVGVVSWVMAFSSFAMPADTLSVAPAMMKLAFFGAGVFGFLFTLIGVWWLVYFNLRRIRALFAANVVHPLPELLPQAHVPVAGVWIDPRKSKRSAIEVMVICLAALYFLGALYGIAEVFVQFPLFFLGHIFRGTSAAVSGIVLAIVDLGLGVGLLRRMKSAWVSALVFNAFSLVCMLVILNPHEHARMADYQQEIMRRMLSGLIPQPPSSQFMLGPAYLFGGILVVLTTGAVFWLLLLARPLFESKSTAS
jgi:hypothetical protein